MVNEHSTNPEPQGSELSSPDDVATNSVVQPDSIVESGPDSTVDDPETQQDNEAPLVEASEDVSSTDASDEAFQEDFGDVFAGVVETSGDKAEIVTEVSTEAADIEEPSGTEQSVTEESESIEASDIDVSEEDLSDTAPEPDSPETIDSDCVSSAEMTPDETGEGEGEIDINPDAEFVAVSNEGMESDGVDSEASEVQTTVGEVSYTETVVSETDISEVETVVNETDVSDAETTESEADISEVEVETVESETDVSDVETVESETDVSDVEAVVSETDVSEVETVVSETDVSDAESVVSETDVSDAETVESETDVSDAKAEMSDMDVSESQSIVDGVEDGGDNVSNDDAGEESSSDNAEDTLGSSSDDAFLEEEDSVNDGAEADTDESAALDDNDDNDDWGKEEEETMANEDTIPPVDPEEAPDEDSVVEENETPPIASVTESSATPPVQETQPPSPPTPSPPSSAASATKPNASTSGTGASQSAWQKIQPILIAVVVIVLTTLMQWLSLGQGALDTIASNQAEDSNQSSSSDNSILVSLWQGVQPLLVTVLLFSSRTLNSGMGWLLSKIDVDASNAVADGTAPTLPERIQSMPAGDKIWDILETIWKLWTGLLGFLRDRIFPESIRHWSNQVITAIVAFVLIFVLWVSSSLSPSPAQEVASGGSATSVATDVAPSADRPVPTKKANPSKDKTLATSIQEQLTEQFSFRYSDDLIQDVTIDRQRDLLTITIGQEWYDLSDRQQQRLAKTILDQTEDTPFGHLVLVNLDGVRIARKPVVGSGMILFQSVPPVIEEPVVEEPVIVEPVIEEPAIEEPVIENTTALETEVSESTEMQDMSSDDASDDVETGLDVEPSAPSPFDSDHINDDLLVYE